MIAIINGIVASAGKASAGTYRLTLNITGLPESYQIVYNGVTWPGNYYDFPAGYTMANFNPTIAGYTLSPASVANVVMDANKTLSFTATSSSAAGYLPGESKLQINNGIQQYGTFVETSGDFLASGSGGGGVAAVTKYQPVNGSRAFIRIGTGTSCTFGLVDRYEVRDPSGLGVYHNGTRFVVFVQIGGTYTDFPDFNIQVGHFLGWRFNIVGGVKTFTPYYSTDGVNLIELTPPTAFNYQDFTGGTPYFYITATFGTNVVKPQGSNFTLAA